VITEPRFKALLRSRRYRPIVMIDIAVPRDVETAVGKLQNVYLYNVDDLQEVAAGNREKRDEKIAASRAVLAEHVEEFLKWSASRDLGPIVKALYERCNQIAAAELEALYARQPDMPAEQKAELQRLTHRLVGKILHEPVTQLTVRTESTARPTLAAALKKLFALDRDPPA
jgi:glutamyl-tRNA reductase